MKEITLKISTEAPTSTEKLRWYRTKMTLNKPIPGLLFAEIQDALHDWMKFEEGNPNNRYEKFRGKKTKRK